MSTWYIASQNPGTSSFLDTDLVAVNFWVRRPVDGLDADGIKTVATGHHPEWDRKTPGVRTNSSPACSNFYRIPPGRSRGRRPWTRDTALVSQAADQGQLVAGAGIEPAARPVRHHQPSSRDPRCRLGERHGRTTRRGAGPPALVPHEASRATEGGEVDQLDSAPVLDPRRPAAARARWSRATALDMDPDRATRVVLRAEDGHVTESDQQLADARRVDIHRGSRICWRREPSDSQGPCAAPGTLRPRSLPPQIRRARLLPPHRQQRRQLAQPLGAALVSSQTEQLRSRGVARRTHVEHSSCWQRNATCPHAAETRRGLGRNRRRRNPPRLAQTGAGPRCLELLGVGQRQPEPADHDVDEWIVVGPGIRAATAELATRTKRATDHRWCVVEINVGAKVGECRSWSRGLPRMSDEQRGALVRIARSSLLPHRETVQVTALLLTADGVATTTWLGVVGRRRVGAGVAAPVRRSRV